MKTKYYLTLSDAEFLLNQAHPYAIQQQFNVSIALVDETGNLLAMKRMDGAAPISAIICQEKAKCSALSTKPSKVFEEMIKSLNEQKLNTLSTKNEYMSQLKKQW